MQEKDVRKQFEKTENYTYEKKYKTIRLRIVAKLLDYSFYLLASIIVIHISKLFNLSTIKTLTNMIGFAMFILYNIFFVYKYHRTVGKSLVGLKIENTSHL